VDEVKPIIKKCQSERARAAIANARAQVAAFLADLPSHRQRVMFLTGARSVTAPSAL
jgi:isopentenyl diphosphate isomerase/L-lactate dehydrogenase-like FMN-dependent dehydrogenase